MFCCCYLYALCGFECWPACCVSLPLVRFFGCVFSHAFSGFASGCCLSSALPWVLNCLGWAFTPGVIRLRFGRVWALTWVMPPRTIIYYLPKTFKTLLMGNADWVIVLAGRSETLFCLMEKDSISGFSLYALLSGFCVFMLSVSG